MTTKKRMRTRNKEKYRMNDDPISIRADWMKPHEYFLIKPRRNAGDMRYINNVGFKVSMGAGEGQILSGEFAFATVVRMLRGWNLTETKTAPDGTTTEVPILFDPAKREQCIENLDGDYYGYLVAELDNRQNAGRLSVQEQKKSSSAATSGSEASQTDLQSQS